MTIQFLDLYCSLFGCSVGYEMAADDLGIKINITGVDIAYPNVCRIPPGYHFVQNDAIKFVEKYGKDFTHIHASPPCQINSRLNVIHKKKYPDLVAPTREALRIAGKPYVIENVPGAPLINPLRLKGHMFGLNIVRERWFETSFFLLQPLAERQRDKTRANGGTLIQATGHSVGTTREWQDAMQIYWMDKPELAQAIPWAYTRWIGHHWFEKLT